MTFLIAGVRLVRRPIAPKLERSLLDGLEINKKVEEVQVNLDSTIKSLKLFRILDDELSPRMAIHMDNIMCVICSIINLIQPAHIHGN